MKTLICATILALAVPAASFAQDMKGMDVKGTAQDVRKVNAKAGKVTFAHERVKTMNWPAMTMVFQFKDKAMLDELREGQKVEFEIEQRGKEHVIADVE